MRTLAIATAILAILLPASGEAARGKVKRTGQATSFGALGDTTAGLTASYVDNGLGFVKDQRTGLVWEKKSDDGSVHDRDNVYTWSTGDPWSATGTAFTVFLAALNTPPCFAGSCDWRLPTLNELETIRDIGTFWPATSSFFDTNCQPACSVTTCSCTKPAYYWSSSTLLSGGAWTVDFGYGNVIADTKTKTYSVRAVRSGW